jgi:hypothetical protein
MCKKLSNEFPAPDYVGEFGGRCWDVDASTKIWEHNPGRFELTTHLKLKLTAEQALSITRGLKPEPPRDLKLAQLQVADMLMHQCKINKQPVSRAVADDAAAQIVQALPVLGRVDDEETK